MHKAVPMLKLFTVHEHCDLVTFASVGSRTVSKTNVSGVCYLHHNATGNKNRITELDAFFFFLKRA